MGQFEEAVGALLEAFGHGLAVLKTHRRKEKGVKARASTNIKTEELRLKRSLEKSKAEVQSIYSLNFAKYGTHFAEGDVRSRASIASILASLNTALVDIIGLIKRGKCSRKDYETLANSSDTSCIMATRTFSKLSLRLSLSAQSKSSDGRRGKVYDKIKPPRPRSSPHDERSFRAQSQSKKTPERQKMIVFVKPVKKANRSRIGQEWKQRRGGKLLTSIKPSVGFVMRSSQNCDVSGLQQKKEKKEKQTGGKKKAPMEMQTQPSTKITGLPKLPLHNLDNTPQRKSLISFMSDTTELGEIPEQRWAETAQVTANGPSHMSGTAFPLTPWQEIEKPRSRFIWPFRRRL
ncbi:MAG: hypothetical protein M1818_004698 [Claussenomyces sp. TS43310]|nr:MAG: hypothetical protein M1818_004698 [Claussenomyces sp. TS43310]